MKAWITTLATLGVIVLAVATAGLVYIHLDTSPVFLAQTGMFFIIGVIGSFMLGVANMEDLQP